MRPVRNDRHGRRNDLTLESPKQTVDFSCLGSAIRSRCSRFTVNRNFVVKKAQGCKSLLKSLHLATAQVLKLTVKILGPQIFKQASMPAQRYS